MFFIFFILKAHFPGSQLLLLTSCWPADTLNDVIWIIRASTSASLEAWTVGKLQHSTFCLNLMDWLSNNVLYVKHWEKLKLFFHEHVWSLTFYMFFLYIYNLSSQTWISSVAWQLKFQEWYHFNCTAAPVRSSVFSEVQGGWHLPLLLARLCVFQSLIAAHYFINTPECSLWSNITPESKVGLSSLGVITAKPEDKHAPITVRFARTVTSRCGRSCNRASETSRDLKSSPGRDHKRDSQPLCSFHLSV